MTSEQEDARVERVRAILLRARNEFAWNSAHAALYDLDALTTQIEELEQERDEARALCAALSGCAAERDKRIEALETRLRMLADEAARAVTEPRRFHQNEDSRQQALGFAIGVARNALAARTEGNMGGVLHQEQADHLSRAASTEDSDPEWKVQEGC